VSPLSVRRYRAERLLREEFEGMRGKVLGTVLSRLRAAGVSLDPADLEACYAQAWHGLYATMLEGSTEIANPAGWLAVVTYRRAIDEHRALTRVGHADESAEEIGAPERDLADELDDRARLRQLMEGLRARLTPRERQAAALCYLQGLSRADAADRMGVSEARMRKLMDGPRPGSPGVAAKVGEILQSILSGSFCSEQSSLMRGFAYGILDPAGERYQLAQAHQRACPACRAYVLSLRGLASVLPPLPLPLALGAGLAVAGGTGAAAGGGTGAVTAGGTGATAGGATAGGVGVGAAGTAGAGGGWLVAGGGLGAKLVAGCLLAVGVGAGCVALTGGPLGLSHATHHRHDARTSVDRASDASETLSSYSLDGQPVAGVTLPSRVGSQASAKAGSSSGSSSALTPAARASREFGLEQALRAGAGSSRSEPHLASAMSARRRPSGASGGSGGSGGSGSSGGSGGSSSGASGESGGAGSSTTSAGGSSSGQASSGASSGGASSSGPPSDAEREFGIG
jgi:RNA polymerase sigma factor (sigma-70 family)